MLKYKVKKAIISLKGRVRIPVSPTVSPPGGLSSKELPLKCFQLTRDLLLMGGLNNIPAK